MKHVSQLTDRAKRYRANAAHKKRKRCECANRNHGHGAICGSRDNLGVGHRDGNESNGKDSNLFTVCKSCNAKQAIADKKAGRGVRTRQYNPGAKTLGAYVDAAVNHTRGAHDEGGRVIHETPKSKRREFAREIAWRKSHNPRGRVEGELPVEDKTPHTEVDYEPHSKHLPDKCGNCANFIPADPPRCLTVKSPISQKAWCERYTQISSVENPSDRVYKEWKAGKLRTSAGVLVPRGTAGEKQARAIILSELRREGKIPARMNPGDTDADELYRLFHGRAPDESYLVDVPMIDAYAQHPDLTQLGFGTRIIVGEGVLKMGGENGDEVLETEDTFWVEEIDFIDYDKWEAFAHSLPDDMTQADINRAKQYLRTHHAPDVAATPPARQLYFIGGNQNLDPLLERLHCDPTKDVCDLGFCYLIEYFTQKRFDDFRSISYWHHFGERSGEHPRVIYERGPKLVRLVGGAYLVTRRGIEN